MIVLLVLPDRVGEAVLGDSWVVAEPLLLATGVQIVFLGLMAGVRAGLLGMRAIPKVMRIDLGATVLVLVASIVGAEINGALGAIWAITLVQALLTIVMWTTFLRLTSHADATGGLNEDAARLRPAERAGRRSTDTSRPSLR
jgi:O-antigen/teichoic acid export membrane protein